MSATTARHSPHRPRETSWSSWRRRHRTEPTKSRRSGGATGRDCRDVRGQLRDDARHLGWRLACEVEVARRLEQRFEPALLGALAQQRLGRRAAAVGAVERRRRRAAHRVQRRDGGRVAAIDDFGRDVADVARRAREAAAAPRRPHRPLAPAGRAAARRDERLRLGEERLRLGHHARRLCLVGAPVEDEALDLVGVDAADEHHRARKLAGHARRRDEQAARLQVRHGRQHGEGAVHTAQKVAWRSSSSCEPPLATRCHRRRHALCTKRCEPTQRHGETRSPPCSKQMRAAAAGCARRDVLRPSRLEEAMARGSWRQPDGRRSRRTPLWRADSMARERRDRWAPRRSRLRSPPQTMT